MKKIEPVVLYMKENPKASVKEVCEKFMLDRKTVYYLRSHYGFTNKHEAVKPKDKPEKPSIDERKDKLIQEMLEQIVRQEAIINYLENKLARHGVAI